jgi:4-carboxymuconolactone decarboxylase
LADPHGTLLDLATSTGASDALATSKRLSLDDKTDALVRLAALVALGAAPATYLCTVQLALDAGATVDEVIDTLLALSTTVGLARVVAATPQLASALGFDLDGPLEESR